MNKKYISSWIESWDDYTDQERWKVILKHPEQFNIQIDNDDIIVILKENVGEDDPPYYQMDSYGYYALVELLQSQNIDADLV